MFETRFDTQKTTSYKWKQENNVKYNLYFKSLKWWDKTQIKFQAETSMIVEDGPLWKLASTELN